MGNKSRYAVVSIAIAIITSFVGFYVGINSKRFTNDQAEREEKISQLQATNTHNATIMRLSADALKTITPGAAHLRGKKIALFITHDANSSTIGQVQHLLQESGAEVNSYIKLNPLAYDDTKTSQTISVINHTLPAGATIKAHYISSGERLGVELSWLTLKPASGMEHPTPPESNSGPGVPHPAPPAAQITPPHPAPAPVPPKAHPAPSKPQPVPSKPAPSKPTPAPIAPGTHPAPGKPAPAPAHPGKTNPPRQPAPAHPAPHKPAPNKPSPSTKPPQHGEQKISVETGTVLDKEIKKSVRSLQDNHLISVVGSQPSGVSDYAIVITGDRYSPGQSVILAQIANGLAERGAGVVLTAPSANESSPVASARTIDSFKRRITTVDDGDLTLGEVSTVLALHHGRKVEQYGLAKTATKVFPS